MCSLSASTPNHHPSLISLFHPFNADRLRRFPAVAAHWHTAAAYAQLAEAQRGEGELGAAVASMAPALSKAREALDLVSDCLLRLRRPETHNACANRNG